MVSSREIRGKKRARSRDPNGKFVRDDLCNLESLFHVMKSPEGMKPRVLKNLYRHLSNISSNAQWAVKYLAGSHDFDLEFCLDGIKVAFGSIFELSNILFKQLEERFERLFSSLVIDHADDALGPSSWNSCLIEDMEIVSLLFRCCLMLLTLLAEKQSLVLEKGLILLKIVRNLSSPDLAENTASGAFLFEKSVFCECEPGDDGSRTTSIEGFTASLQILGLSNPILFVKSIMLEVFVDELLANRQLRRHFQIINSFASTNEALFSQHWGQEDIAIVIAVLCNHFILSFSDEQACREFLGRLFSTHATRLKYPLGDPALTLTTSALLIFSPFMASMPKYMQAHLMSLVSEAIYTKSLKSDPRVINCFLSIFEKSVNLYVAHMSCLEKDGYPSFPRGFKPNFSCGVVLPPFELYILPETKKKIEFLIVKLDDSLNVNSDDISYGRKSDLVSSSLRFVKECLNAYSTASQDEILTLLSCLVLETSGSCDSRNVGPIEGSALQHLYLLASILKLMGISLLQTVSYHSHNDHSSCGLETSEDFGSCKEYDFVLNAIACFVDFNIRFPMQQDVVNMVSGHSTRHLPLKIMFMHFVGMMSLSFSRGLDFLVKACLLVILALLNLFIFEKGDLDEFRSVVDSNEEHFPSKSSVVHMQEAVSGQSSSLVVASKFQQIRSLCSRAIQCKNNENEAQNVGTSGGEALDTGLKEEETEETSNGEVFLQCVLETCGGLSSAADLVDFVECKQGKDYSFWLKNRSRFRRWRSERLAVVRWKRKKKTWRIVKG